MADPHAKYEDGRIWWRGSNHEFRDMDAEGARGLLAEFEAANWAGFGEAGRLSIITDLRAALTRLQSEHPQEQILETA